MLWEPTGRSSSLYPEGSTTEGRMYWAVRLGRSKAFQSGTSRSQNRDVWKITLFMGCKRFARLELGIYINEWQDGILMSSGQEQKGFVGPAWKSAFMGNLSRIWSREVTRDLCFRRLILAALKRTTQKQGGTHLASTSIVQCSGSQPL